MRPHSLDHLQGGSSKVFPVPGACLPLSKAFLFSRFEGVHAATPAGERVHTPGVPTPGAEEGGGEEDAVPGLHHVGMVGLLKGSSI